MKKRLYIIFFFSICTLFVYSQQSITEVIDSLHAEYALYPDKGYHLRDTTTAIPPPPPLEGYANCEDCYIEAYAIPSEVILQYYPWNADSITIAFDLQKQKEIKLEKGDLEKIVNTLYKFEYDTDKPCISVVSVIGSGSPYPNFRLTFYHKDESSFADFYRHIDNPMRIIDSSCGDPYKFITDAYPSSDVYQSLVYWGSLFHLTFDQLADYIEDRFGENVREGKYENDFYEEIDLKDLIERKVGEE